MKKAFRKVAIALLIVITMLIAAPVAVILTDCETNRVVLLNGGRSAARVTLKMRDRLLWAGALAPWSPWQGGFDMSEGGFTVSVTYPESSVKYTDQVGYVSRFDGTVPVIFVDEEGARFGQWERPPIGASEPTLWEAVRLVGPIVLQGLSCMDKRLIEGRPL